MTKDEVIELVMQVGDVFDAIVNVPRLLLRV
jgi:hypothetical protein